MATGRFPRLLVTPIPKVGGPHTLIAESCNLVDETQTNLNYAMSGVRRLRIRATIQISVNGQVLTKLHAVRDAASQVCFVFE